MRLLLTLFLSVCLVACATNPKSNETAVDLKNLNDVRAYVSSGADINQPDGLGRTLLHHAALDAPDAIPVLLNAGAKVNVQDKFGFTPLHLATQFQPSRIRTLLLAGADIDLVVSGKYRCSKTSRVYFENVNPYELAYTCQYKRAMTEFDVFLNETEAWKQAVEVDTFQAYEGYLQEYTNGLFHDEASKRFLERKSAHTARLESGQPCKLVEEGWYYTKGACKKALAHGKGESVNLEGDAFIGEFEFGQRKKGQWIVQGSMTYDGEFEDGLPHGLGVCLFEGAFEECKMYKGERIGALFKQRAAFRADMSELKSEIEALKKTVYRQASYRTTASSHSSSRYDYVSDLNSSDDTKRTVSRIKAAVDIISFIAQAAAKD